MKQLASLAEALDDIEIRIAELLAKSRTSSSPRACLVIQRRCNTLAARWTPPRKVRACLS